MEEFSAFVCVLQTFLIVGFRVKSILAGSSNIRREGRGWISCWREGKGLYLPVHCQNSIRCDAIGSTGKGNMGTDRHEMNYGKTIGCCYSEGIAKLPIKNLVVPRFVAQRPVPTRSPDILLSRVT